MILANKVNLDGKDITVTDFYQDPGMTRLSMQYNDAEDLGPFTLVFTNNPFVLKQWKVITPQSLEVSLSLYDSVIDAKINQDLFKFNKKKQTAKKKSGRRK